MCAYKPEPHLTCAEVRVELCFVLTFCNTISRPTFKVKYFLNIFCISVDTTLYPTEITPVFIFFCFAGAVSVRQTGFPEPEINKEGTRLWQFLTAAQPPVFTTKTGSVQKELLKSPVPRPAARTRPAARVSASRKKIPLQMPGASIAAVKKSTSTARQRNALITSIADAPLPPLILTDTMHVPARIRNAVLLHAHAEERGSRLIPNFNP